MSGIGKRPAYYVPAGEARGDYGFHNFTFPDPKSPTTED